MDQAARAEGCEDLRGAITRNPKLKVLFLSGYYDLATPFLATEYTVSHLEGLSAGLRDNISLRYYDAGHMMYLYEPELAKLKQNVARFITGAAPAAANGAPPGVRRRLRPRA